MVSISLSLLSMFIPGVKMKHKCVALGEVVAPLETPWLASDIHLTTDNFSHMKSMFSACHIHPSVTMKLSQLL